MEFMPIWIQIHKIPEAYRKESVVRQLVTRQAGEVITVEMHPSGAFRGDFVRVRLNQDVRKPLARFLSVSLGGKRSVFMVKYEKLGMLCFACGLIGHDYKECGTGVYEENDLKFGDWIYAFTRRGRGLGPGQGDVRGGRSAMHGRGRGTADGGGPSEGQGNMIIPVHMGRGKSTDELDYLGRKVTSAEDDLTDTATSPSKPIDQHMLDLEKNAKKRLDFDKVSSASVGVLPLTNAMHVDGDSVVPPSETGDQVVKDQKRYKREDGTSVSGQSNGSAASFEDDRRAQ